MNIVAQGGCGVMVEYSSSSQTVWDKELLLSRKKKSVLELQVEICCVSRQLVVCGSRLEMGRVGSC